MKTIALSASEVTPTPMPKVQNSSTTKRKLLLAKVIPVTTVVQVQDLTVDDATRVSTGKNVYSSTIEAASIALVPGPRMETFSGHKKFTKRFKSAKSRPKTHPVQSLQTKF